MSSILTKLKESTQIFGAPVKEHQTSPSRTVILGAIEQGVGVYNVPSMRDMVQTFYRDSILREGVQSFSDQVISTGVYYSGNPDYQEKLNGKTALDVIKEWADKNDIDLKLPDIIMDMRAFGNEVFIINDFGFVKVPVEALWHAKKIADDIPLQQQYDLELDPLYGSVKIRWGEFVHFRINMTGFHAPFGTGIMYGLLARPVDRFGKTCPSIYDIRLSMRGSLDEGFRKFSFGNVWIGVPDLSNEDFDASGLSDKVANMKSTGNRIITNSDVKIGLEVPQRTQSYDSFIENMRNEFFMSLSDPSLKLGLEGGYTKATAESAAELYKYKIATFRKAIKNQFEDLFKQILNKMGYDGEKAAITMNFGPEESPTYMIADIFDATDREIIGKDEARSLLIKYHKWDLNSSIKLPTLEEDLKKKKEAGNLAENGKVSRPLGPKDRADIQSKQVIE